MRLLSVDWDYFFPIPKEDDERSLLYDWGHREGWKFLMDGVWQIRAEAFLRSGFELPSTDGKEIGFWNRFKFNTGTKLYIADSHTFIYDANVRRNIRSIVNFDAHHDAYQRPADCLDYGKVECQNWASFLRIEKIKVTWVKPNWHQRTDTPKYRMEILRDEGQNFDEPFDRIYICRSGAWTPSWVEDKFWKFVGDCPIQPVIEVRPIEKRIYDAVEVATAVQVTKDFYNNFIRGKGK